MSEPVVENEFVQGFNSNQSLVEEDYYQVFFASKAGKRVLNHLLFNLRHYHEAVSQDDIVKQNFAKWILRNCGVWKKPNSMLLLDSYKEIVDGDIRD